MDGASREALEAKADAEKLELFIAKYRRFVLFCAIKTLHRFVSESDDEHSIALIAFSEAVKTYEEDKGSFKPFAALVIKRRLTDHLRKEYRHADEVSVDSFATGGEVDSDEDGVDGLQLEVRKKMAELSETDVTRTPGTTAVQDEIAAIGQTLSEYGFSFYDLTECSPHSEKTRAACADAVIAILKDGEMFALMRKNKSLPMKELVKRSGVKLKTLERHRRYVIAAVEILAGDYPQIGEYMRYIKDRL